MNTLTHSSYNYKTIEAKTVKRNSLLIGQIWKHLHINTYIASLTFYWYFMFY